MNDTPQKLRGGESELTKLKRVWQRPDFEPVRELWRQRFSSELTQAQIRVLLKNELRINLQWDRQMTQFRQWVDRQDSLDAERAARVDDAARILDELGDKWTVDQIRDEIFKHSYVRALATADFDLGRKTIAQEMNVEKVSLNKEKFSYYKEDTQARALEKVLKDTDQCPNARNQFKAAFAALTEEQYTNDFGRSQSGELDNALKRCLWETEKYPRARQQFKTALAVLKEEQEKERFADPPGYLPTPSEGPSNPIQPDPTKSNPSVCSSGRKSAPSSHKTANQTPSPRQAAADPDPIPPLLDPSTDPAQPIGAPSPSLPAQCFLLMAVCLVHFQHLNVSAFPLSLSAILPGLALAETGASHLYLCFAILTLLFTCIFTLISPCFIEVYSSLFTFAFISFCRFDHFPFLSHY